MDSSIRERSNRLPARWQHTLNLGRHHRPNRSTHCRASCITPLQKGLVIRFARGYTTCCFVLQGRGLNWYPVSRTQKRARPGRSPQLSAVGTLDIPLASYKAGKASVGPITVSQKTCRVVIISHLEGRVTPLRSGCRSSTSDLRQDERRPHDLTTISMCDSLLVTGVLSAVIWAVIAITIFDIYSHARDSRSVLAYTGWSNDPGCTMLIESSELTLGYACSPLVRSLSFDHSVMFWRWLDTTALANQRLSKRS